ncbi:hypothetical protein E2C01_025472 [Portunus trituberculatus]|uniref:Uncharacterized protein n=1 Tax=Portunus trituberculatus TaxID=210409 RepID=A0A5B7EFP2_PORTR|nr:hypothetical protein [Portunus trituberculatus]
MSPPAARTRQGREVHCFHQDLPQDANTLVYLRFARLSRSLKTACGEQIRTMYRLSLERREVRVGDGVTSVTLRNG